MNSMCIGFTADRFRFLSAADVLRLFRWCGLSFAEVTTSVFSRPDDALRNARGMKLGLHLPNAGNRGYDFSSRNHAEQIQNDLTLIRRYGGMFAFQYALFHPSETGEKEVMDFYIRNLKETRLSLILENIRGYDSQVFLDLYRRFKDSLGDQLWGICLDVPHAHLTSQDWESYYRLLKSHIRVIHLSDCRDGEDKHLPFGMGGELSLKSIIFFLKGQKFEGYLNFEILPPSMPGMIGIIKMIQQVRNLQEAVEKP